MPVRGGETLVQPVFFRNFAGQGTLNHGIGPDLTFTRNSIGTYYDQNGILRTASANVPRFDYDPATLQPLGLLIEDSNTNSLQRSEDFSNAYWTKANTSVLTAAGISPADTNTANKIIEDTTTGSHQIQVFYSYTINTYFTLSCFLKAGEISTCKLIMANAGNAFAGQSISAVIDLQNETAYAETTTPQAPYVAIKKINNGWYRVSITAQTTSTASDLVVLRLTHQGSNFYTGNGINGLFAWGMQLEAFSFPTSYIPTTAGAVNRSTDTCIINNNTFFNSKEGTLYVEAMGTYNGSYNNGFVGFDDGTSNNRIFIRRAPVTINCSRGTVINGVLQNSTTNSANSWPVGTYGKCSYGYQAGNFAGFYNTIGATSAPQDAIPSNLSVFRVGTSMGSNAANGGIAKVAYWPIRLSNFQLQQLTI